MQVTMAVRSRAQGCLLGQVAGDALGSQVEFNTAEAIRHAYPDGLYEIAGSPIYHTIPGQPTDDSEMALALARTLVDRQEYDPEAALEAYRRWLASHPFDYGRTVFLGLNGERDFDSQANGALMRISPLGIFGVSHLPEQVARWARQDAELTHPNEVCLAANALYAMAIAWSIANGPDPDEVHERIVMWSEELSVTESIAAAVAAARTEPPAEYIRHQGWVLIAFQNALWQMLHAPSLEEGVVDTVMRGGDTDTNAAICAALLGAIYGREAIPAQWAETVLTCRPEEGRPGVYQPRPQEYWPVDVLRLADQLVGAGREE